MTFQNYVCWRSENVHRILNIEATQSPDHIFLATHHPIVMKRGELISGGVETSYNENDFLKEFLASPDFAFVPVLGSSGTGKSHLIRWLKANIETTERRLVLLIPKLGTNLKDIIGMILNLPQLRGEKFDEYRLRLNQATNSLTEGETRQQLLNQLAIAVGDNNRRNRSRLTEVQDYLIGELNSLLYDPFFRQHWLKDGGIIHRLIVHILGQQHTVDIVEERREFTIKDLPRDVLDIQRAGEQSREFYSYLLSDDTIGQETVNWLNQHLDEAITKVLNLNREDLQSLMREVRQTLAEQNIELVLLIEDFAKLQGIDRELLEAVLARPGQGNERPLCAIRTALACTRGYFESLIETVRQRVSFSVNLDVGQVGDRSLVTETNIQQFVARYLNAIRLEDREIRHWAEDHDSTNDKGLPSFCDGCPHREPCHSGFGEVNGIGLYPFTPLALKQMLGRVNPGDFNPRILLKDVLKYTLENSVTYIERGCFPSSALREHFGKVRLSAIVQGEIADRDNLNAERRQTLIDLWTDNDTLCDLPDEIHLAFNIPPLGAKIATTRTTPEITPPPGGAKEDDSKLPERLIRQLESLNGWNNQGILSQELEKELREFIYPAVTERIEWDNEILIKGNFTGNTQVFNFKQRNVIFYSPRVTRATHSGITLSLPLRPDDPDDFRETAIAFQGILQYNHYKHWNFPDGDRYFRAYAAGLERWSEYILEQIRRRPRTSQEEWNPVPATVELLAIAAAMAGQPMNSPENSINALFLPLEEGNTLDRGKSWRELFKVFQTNREKLLEILTSRIACTKGGNRTFQMIDAVNILGPLKGITRSWQPQYLVPDDLNSQYQPIKNVRDKVDSLLMGAIEEEVHRQLGLYTELKSELGENFKKKEVIDTVKEAITISKDAGVFGQRRVEDLTKIVDQFERIRLNNYVENMKRIETIVNSTPLDMGKLLNYVGQNHHKAMICTHDFLIETKDFLNKSTAIVTEQISLVQGRDETSIEAVLQSIDGQFNDLRSLLERIRG